MSVISLVLAVFAGAALCFFILRERLNYQKSQLLDLELIRQENARLLSTVGQLTGRLETVDAAKGEMAQAFRSASTQVIRESATQFLELAQERFERLKGDAGSDLLLRQNAIGELVKPLRDTLEKVELQVRKVEQDRIGAYSVLTNQVKGLEAEARKLATALASPSARGRWGEVQLRRVIEMADMLEYCDFTEQVNIPGSEGRLRPDVIILLPNEKQIVVDSKVPLTAYMAACEITDDQARRPRLEEHARQLRAHIKLLGSKSYSAQLACSPEFVVAFLPGEVFFSAALQVDGELLEYGVQNNVILATPTTLIALLKAVAHGWKQEQVARNAQEIKRLGLELYERIRIFASHYEGVGKALRSAVLSYDKGRTSMETRLLSTARKFEEFGVGPTSAGALPERLPFLEDLGLGVANDERRGDSGGSGESTVTGRA